MTGFQLGAPECERPGCRREGLLLRPSTAKWLYCKPCWTEILSGRPVREERHERR